MGFIPALIVGGAAAAVLSGGGGGGGGEANVPQPTPDTRPPPTPAPDTRPPPTPAPDTRPPPTPAPSGPQAKSFDEWEKTYKGPEVSTADFMNVPNQLKTGGLESLMTSGKITDPMGYSVRRHGRGWMIDWGNGNEMWTSVRSEASARNDARIAANAIKGYQDAKAAAAKEVEGFDYDAKYNAYKDYVSGLGADFTKYDPGGVTGAYGDASGKMFRNEDERKAAEQKLYDTATSGANDFQTWLSSQGDAAPATFNDQRAGYEQYLADIYNNTPTGVQAKTYTSLLPGVASDYGNLAGTYFESEAAKNAAERAAYNQSVSSFPDFYTWYNSQGTDTYGNPQAALEQYTKLVTDTFGNAPGSVSQPANPNTLLSDANNLANYYGYLDNLGLNTSSMDRGELQQAYGMAQNLDRKNAAIADVQGKLESAKGQYDTLFGNYNTTLSDLNTVQNQLQDLQSNYNTITGDYGSLQSTYDNLQSQYSNLQQDLTSYANQMDTLQSTYDDLYGDYNNLIGENQQLFTNLGDTQTQLGNLQTDYTGLQTQFGDLSGQYDALQGQYTNTLSELDRQRSEYERTQDLLQQQYTQKLQEDAARNLAAQQARKEDILSQYTPVATVPQASPLDPGSYSAPTIDYTSILGAAAPNLMQPIDLSMPQVDFVNMYAPVPLAPQMQQSAPQLDFTAPFQPYLQAVQQQYGATTPTAYTGIMGGNRTS